MRWPSEKNQIEAASPVCEGYNLSELKLSGRGEGDVLSAPYIGWRSQAYPVWGAPSLGGRNYPVAVGSSNPIEVIYLIKARQHYPV